MTDWRMFGVMFGTWVSNNGIELQWHILIGSALRI